MFEQPPSLAGDPVWSFQPRALGGDPGGAQMIGLDVDGDGDRDVVSSLDAHGYGLAWFERAPSPTGHYEQHLVLPEGPAPRVGVQFSQLHGLAAGDLDGDGVDDVVTGKTWLAHNGTDPGWDDPPVVFALLTRRSRVGVTFAPILVDDDSGIGRQLALADVDRDGRLDVITGNKKGCFVHRRQ